MSMLSEKARAVSPEPHRNSSIKETKKIGPGQLGCSSGRSYRGGGMKRVERWRSRLRVRDSSARIERLTRN